MKAARTTELLLAQDGGGQNNLRAIRKYAYGFAAGRNMPMHLVEDAVAEALIKILKVVHTYDSRRAKFTTWAIAIVKNELKNAARADTRRNAHVEFSVDDLGEDGVLVIEAVLGYTFDIHTLIAREDRTELHAAMKALAHKIFGNYATVVDGQPIRLPLLDACVTAYERRDGQTWAAIASRETGISQAVISNKKADARRTWDSWKEREMTSLDLQPGGLDSST